MMTALLVGLVSCGLLGLVGRTWEALTRGGLIVLAILGGLVFSSGGWTWGLLVIAVLAAHFGLIRLGRAEGEKPHDWRVVIAVWGPLALVALIYGATEHAAVWAAFIGATAYAGTERIMPNGRRLTSALTVGTLTGGVMLALHDAAAVRRDLPTGWIDLWLIPLGTVGALTGVAVQMSLERRLSLHLARLFASVSAAIVTTIVGQVGWRLFG